MQWPRSQYMAPSKHWPSLVHGAQVSVVALHVKTSQSVRCVGTVHFSPAGAAVAAGLLAVVEVAAAKVVGAAEMPAALSRSARTIAPRHHHSTSGARTRRGEEVRAAAAIRLKRVGEAKCSFVSLAQVLRKKVSPCSWDDVNRK